MKTPSVPQAQAPMARTQPAAPVQAPMQAPAARAQPAPAPAPAAAAQPKPAPQPKPAGDGNLTRQRSEGGNPDKK